MVTGPTGAGKSSLIDGITFALYGSVHRHGSKDVAPVVTQGRQEARVRLDFEVGGRSYTAVRVVRRTKAGGATTSEARLQCGEEVLAASAGELTTWVNRLIGVPFEHFTRCVVLPQGEFARFLHDKPADRQELLVELLDLAIYGRMASVANQRAKIAEETIARNEGRLARELADATSEARDAVRLEIDRFQALARRVDETRPKLDELAQAVAKAREAERVASVLVEQLEAVAAPPGDLELARKTEAAQAEVKKASSAEEKARQRVDTATQARRKLPDAAPLRDLLVAHERRTEQSRAMAAARKRLEAEKTAEEAAAKAVEKAKGALAAAQSTLDAVMRQNLGAALAEKLEVGEACPVCGVVIRKLPHAEPPKDLKKAQAAHQAAEKALDLAQTRHRAAHASAERVAGEVATHEKQIAALQKTLAKAPELDAIQATLAAIAAADEGVSAAREACDRAATAAAAARARLEGASKAQDAAWRRLDRMRDAVAVLRPPAVDRRDLAAAWAALERWAREEAPNQRERMEAARGEARAANESAIALRADLDQAVAAAGLAARGEDLRTVSANALARARARLDAVESAIAEAQRLRDEVAELRGTSQVAAFLGRHLGARYFESWILERVLRGLAASASHHLLQLSGDAYSFELDEKNREFLVVDHANAGEVRSARTLSGGETFLASLALALALSEQVSHLAARGAARLDALFLDEGFGALDPETLEVAARAIEELGAQGRMVGIVTHVRELADRIPVRFEVSKDARTSRVSRVDGAEDECEPPPMQPPAMAAV